LPHPGIALERKTSSYPQVCQKSNLRKADLISNILFTAIFRSIGNLKYSNSFTAQNIIRKLKKIYFHNLKQFYMTDLPIIAGSG